MYTASFSFSQSMYSSLACRSSWACCADGSSWSSPYPEIRTWEYFTSKTFYLWENHNSISPFREINNVVAFSFPFHTFIALANLWLICLHGQFLILRTRSCPDLFPLNRPQRKPLSLELANKQYTYYLINRPCVSIYVCVRVCACVSVRACACVSVREREREREREKISSWSHVFDLHLFFWFIWYTAYPPLTPS